MMTEIRASLITEAVAALCAEANTCVPPDVVSALARAADAEKDPRAMGVLEMLRENACIARREARPICQDTGMAVIFLEIGQDAHIAGGDLTEAVNAGVARGYAEGFLRKSVVADPIKRVNTGDNTPAVIYTEIVPGDKLKIIVAPKGFGSENMSAVAMLKPSDGLEGLTDFIIKTVREAGPNPCPPVIVGVGAGGTLEKAALMAKKALTRPVGGRNPDPVWARRELEWLRAINGLNIGPAGLGGATTALDVHAEVFPTHIAGLPVAVNISCHVYRHAAAWLDAEGFRTERGSAGDGPAVFASHRDKTLGAASDTERRQSAAGGAESSVRLSAPLSDEAVNGLRAGDSVLLSGIIYTARDAAHKRLCEMLENGGGERLSQAVPGLFQSVATQGTGMRTRFIDGSAVFYAGPSPAKPGGVIGSIGPTTSGRMDAYSPGLIGLGLRAMIGKGRRGGAVKDAIRRYGGVYLIAVGGAAALMSKCVKGARIVAFEDLGAEAIHELVVEDMPLIVGIDALGNDVYDAADPPSPEGDGQLGG